MDKVIVKEQMNKSTDVMWKLITELDHMKQWFFENIPDFKPEVEFKTQFIVVSDSRSFLHSWKIVDVIKGKLITYKWRYPEYSEKDSRVSFVLDKSFEGNTELTIIAEGISNFPSEIPEFTYESCKAGWTYFIRRLKEYSKAIN
ncbi:SRPBCC domain-containing protein [Tenacibaculum sp. 190524A05c]|uniref:Activator of Hsp90 ATPase homologue 1/2-like C-terminal domain-containing protein n=1 Tax=Tenacibaculum platacis TaxID=3137852 RepID=A0ABM9P1U2_9FLAO